MKGGGNRRRRVGFIRERLSSFQHASSISQVTPERCRASMKSLLEENDKSLTLAQAKEEAVRRLRDLADYEAREAQDLRVGGSADGWAVGGV